MQTRKNQVPNFIVPYRTVSELILQHDRRWDMEKVTSYFDPLVARKIHCILFLHKHSRIRLFGKQSPQEFISFRVGVEYYKKSGEQIEMMWLIAIHFFTRKCGN